METQQKILSHLIIPHHIYLEQYCFQESLDGLAQFSGVNVVALVCIFSQCPSQMLQLCWYVGAWSQVRLFTCCRLALTVGRVVTCTWGVAALL